MPMSRKLLLSKSRYIRGMQCEKAMYLETFRHRLAEIKPETLRAFDKGRRFERCVKDTFPHAHDLGATCGSNIHRNVLATTKLLAQPGIVTIFEAGFEYESSLVLADVLCRNEQGEIDLYEIKNSDSAKEVFRQDIFVQYWVISHALQAMSTAEGMKQHIRSFSLVLRPSESDDFIGLATSSCASLTPFQQINLTSEAEAQLPVVERRIVHFQDVLKGTEPVTKMGGQCDAPYECPFKNYCSGKKTVQLELSF